MEAGRILAPVERAPAVVTLRPGDIHFAAEPTAVGTVLGSCLSVTVYCARLRAGAICHALFPGRIPAAGAGAFRYVECAIDGMAAWFWRVGARPGEIAVKLFGGAGARWSGAGAPPASLEEEMAVSRGDERLPPDHRLVVRRLLDRDAADAVEPLREGGG